MLATCRTNGWELADYLEPEHPLQMAITASVESHGSPVHHVGVDGCGAPTHVIGLVELARAFSEIAVNGTAISEPGELRREVAKVEDGKTADLSVTRDKKALTLKVEVTSRDHTVERKTRRSL